MRRKSRLANHKLKIMYQDRRGDPNCPEVILWMGCGNIQEAPVDSARVFAGDDAGEQAAQTSYFVSVPKNEITVRAMRKTGRYIVDCDPCSIWYQSIFDLTSDVGQNTVLGRWIMAQLTKIECDSCDDDELFQWCPSSSKCRNGVIVTYTAADALIQTLPEFINSKGWGTTILVPDGTYDGGNITRDYVIVEKADENAVVTLNTPLVDITTTQQVILDLV